MQRSLAKCSLEMSADELDAKLELLQQLCLQDRHDAQAPDNPHYRNPTSYLDERWIQAEYEWAMESTAASTVSLFEDEEEDMDACMPHLYDPTLFSDPRCAPSVPTKPTMKAHHRAFSEKDKPLPELPRPSLVRRGIPDAPPPTPSTPQPAWSKSGISDSPPRSPLRSVFSSSSLRSQTLPATPRSTPRSTPPASPRISAPSARPPAESSFPLSAQPSSPDGAHTALSSPSVPLSSAIQQHAAYPSIASTLEVLERRPSPVEKRYGVLGAGAPNVATDSVASRVRSASSSNGRSNGEAIKPVLAGGSQSPRRRQRPILPALSTSISTPQLRPAAPLNSASSSVSGSSFVSLSTAVTSPSATTLTTSVPSEHSPKSTRFVSNSGLLENDDSQPHSRWSLDSVASRTPPLSFHPLGNSPPSSGAPPTPPSGKKRDRLISFITRGRSGSLGKGTPPMPNPANAALDNNPLLPRSSVSVAEQPVISHRPSLSSSAPPLPVASSSSTFTFASMLTTSTTSSATSSASSLQTPVSLEMHRHASSPSRPTELFVPESPAFVAETHVAPNARPSAGTLLPSFEHADARASYDRPPTPPTSPPPQPTLPAPSPGTPSASFLVSPQLRSQSFFSSLPFKKRRAKKLVITGVPVDESDDARESDWKANERRRRYENVVRWCEGFGEVRKIERKPDGTLHVYWRDWESADMVCRVHAQVYIKDVGRVSLAWQYIS